MGRSGTTTWWIIVLIALHLCVVIALANSESSGWRRNAITRRRRPASATAPQQRRFREQRSATEAPRECLHLQDRNEGVCVKVEEFQCVGGPLTPRCGPGESCCESPGVARVRLLCGGPITSLDTPPSSSAPAAQGLCFQRSSEMCILNGQEFGAPDEDPTCLGGQKCCPKPGRVRADPGDCLLNREDSGAPGRCYLPTEASCSSPLDRTCVMPAKCCAREAITYKATPDHEYIDTLN